MTTDEILERNNTSHILLNAPYDPIRGTGSPLERFIFMIEGMPEGAIELPCSMKDDPFLLALLRYGSVKKAAAEFLVKEEKLVWGFRTLRCKHDFEYWAASCVQIKTKSHRSAPLILNRPQRIFLNELEKQRLAGKAIRIVLLKHRQWGGSTLTQIYIAWIQLFLRMGATSLIVGNVKDQSKHILAMLAKLLSSHPQEIFRILHGVSTIVLRPYAGTANYKRITESDATFGVGSVQEPDALRSQTIHLLHLSEVGSWQSDTKVNAEDLAQTLYGALVDEPLTLCVKESTAQGVGNYFHRECQRARSGESLDALVFIRWFDDPQYMIDPLQLPGISSAQAFILSWDEYEHNLFSDGATIEHLAWRRQKMKNFTDLWRFQQEYPSTPEEAFTSTDHRVFPELYVRRARVRCLPPIAVGELHAADRKGERSLKEIRFEARLGGSLSIWSFPEERPAGVLLMAYYNRYCAFADIGGRGERSDFSVITVIDRLPMKTDCPPVVVAEFHAHMDPDLFAWYAARVCKWYDSALLGVEVNSLYSDRGDDLRGYDADSSLTVLDEIKHHYNNLYYRESFDDVQKKAHRKYGFHMNKQTKPMVINELSAALRDCGYHERCAAACDEFDTYMQMGDGRMGAVKGYHDDRVISRAGALYLSKGMSNVRENPLIKTKQPHGPRLKIREGTYLYAEDYFRSQKRI